MKFSKVFSYNLCLITSLLGNFLFGQTKISGIVKDTIDNPITFTNVFINSINSTVIKKFTHTDKNGNYEIMIDEIGDFEINFTASSYKSKKIIIYCSKKEEEKQLNVVLGYEIVELNEVIIKALSPITIKKDTIVFDIKSFIQGNEQVVEDLLKKIPGLNVSADGVIKVGNQEIEKVMVDGEDFFEKGYKILTKSMPLSPVETIELYQHYSNNKHLKGVENSDKVALNLTLKDDVKRRWFGNTLLGYGISSETRYMGQSNLMNFGKKNKYYFLTNLNNIGTEPTEDINHLIHSSNVNEPGNIGDDQNLNLIMRLNAPLPDLKKGRVNFNNAKMGSFNSIFSFSEKIRMKTLFLFDSDKNLFFRNRLQSFAFKSVQYENIEDLQVNRTQITGFGKVNLTYDVSKNTTIEFISKFNKSDKNSISNLIFNGDSLNQNLKNSNTLIDQKLVFTTEINKKKVLIISARYINEELPQKYTLNQFLYKDLFKQDANNIEQIVENKMQFMGLESHFLNRKNNGNLLEVRLGSQLRKDILDSKFYLKDTTTSIKEMSDYQNNVDYSTNDLYLKSSYFFKFQKIGLLSELSVHQLINSLSNSGNAQMQNVFFVNPRLSLDFEITQKNKMSISYALNKTNTNILDVYPNYIHTDFRSFEKGTGTFNQLNSSSATLNYTYGDWSDKNFVNAYILYSKNYDFFSKNIDLTQNYSISEKIIVKDRSILVFSSNLNSYIKSISSNLKLSLEGSKSNYKDILNSSDLREVESNNIIYGFELQSGFLSFFNYHIGSKWNYSEFKTINSTSYKNNISFLDFAFTVNPKLNFQIQIERYFFDNLEKQNNKYYFVDFQAQYTIKQNKITLSVIGNNLSNTATFKDYNISDVSTSKTEYRLLPLYFLFKMEYKF